MSNEFKFGFKSRRQEKVEEIMKHDFPYVEVIPSKGKGSVTKFRLLNEGLKRIVVSDQPFKGGFWMESL